MSTSLAERHAIGLPDQVKAPVGGAGEIVLKAADAINVTGA